MKIKRIVIISLALAFGMNLYAQTTSLKGQIKGVSNTTVVVQKLVENTMKPFDTLSVDKNGKFAAEYALQEPGLYVLSVPEMKNAMADIWMQPKEKINLEFSILPEINYLQLDNAKGSSNMQTYQRFSQVLGQSLVAQQEMEKEFESPATTDARKKEIQTNFSNLLAKRNQEIEQIIRENKKEVFSAFLATYFENDLTHYITLYAEVRDALKEQYGDNMFVQHLDAVVKQNVLPGMETPDIAMKNAEGEIMKLSDLRGKVVILDFWASWCRPCRMENPNVVRLYHKYHEAGLEIYSVSLDNDKKSWQKAIADDGLVWPNHVSDLQGWTSTGGAAYGVTAVPSTFLIDKEGKLIAKNLRGNELAQKLEEIFGF